MSKRIAVLDAPSNLGLRPPEQGREPGCRRLAAALRANGIVERLGATDAGAVDPPAYEPAFDPVTGVRNGDKIPAYTTALADRVEALVRDRVRPLVLGGDCSILLGATLGLRRVGKYGLAFLDGHLDFRHLGNSQAVGAVAGEDLAIVTGRGAPELTNIDGRRPYVAEEHVVAIGFREGPAQGEATDILETPIRLLPIEEIRHIGVDEAAMRGLDALEAMPTAGFWIHLDADVLDPAIMPAVDSPEPPGGLAWTELETFLRVLWQSPKAVGLEVTVFDPDLDPDGVLAERLTATIVRALTA